MPIALPNLDDRRYRDLVEEARGLIPTYAPEWTNHNPSDPGITLIELFAYLTEILIYRLNRVTDANVAAFLKLIDGVDRRAMSHSELRQQVREVVTELRRPQRAITVSDFETLVLDAFPREVARARCIPERNLEPEDLETRTTPKAGHISVIVVPDSEDTKPVPSSDLMKAVWDYLEPRRLLTTRVHVIPPRFVAVGVSITVVLKSDWLEKDVRPQVTDALRRFLGPLTGGSNGDGWPFGRNVYVSEIYELLDRVPGVDFVTQSVDSRTSKPIDELTVDDATRVRKNETGELIAIEIQPDELVDPAIDDRDITILSR